MTKPQTDLEQKDYFKNTHYLYKVLNVLKNVEEVKLFLKDIFSSSELRMLKKRWHIARILAQGFDIRQTAYKTKSSTQTVMKIKKTLEEGRGGLQIAVNRMSKLEKEENKKYIKSKLPKRSSKFVKGWNK